MIEKACTLSYGDGTVTVRGDTEYEIPIIQLKNVVVRTNAATVTVALLNELSKNNVNTIFCDEKHNPSFEISAYSNNSGTAGKIMEQSLWRKENKALIWKWIVEQKIKNQRKLLEELNIISPDKLVEYEKNVLLDDESNNEGLAARVYFRALFGNDFKRHFPDDINAALNYGYILILSSFNRILTVHGYNTSLGIKHCNKQNKFNLSCDLMEVFRPFIDKIVYKNREKILDWEYKKLLIESLNSTVKYDGREMSITDACEMYMLDVLESVKTGQCMMKEVCFER